jgi:hypothetical protein
VMTVVAATTVSAPPATVCDVYAEYRSWPRLFPTINGGGCCAARGRRLSWRSAISRARSLTSCWSGLPMRSPCGRFTAASTRCSSTVSRPSPGARFTVTGEIHLNGAARLLQPFLPGYVRKRMERLRLQPVKAEAEARARRAAGATRRKRHARGVAETRPQPSLVRPAPGNPAPLPRPRHVASRGEE